MNNIRVEKLGNIIKSFDYMRKPLSTLDRNKRKKVYPYYGANGIIDYVDDFIYDGNYLLMAEDGTVLKDNRYPVIFDVSGKFWVSNHAHVFKSKEEIVKQRFLYYILSQTNITPKVTGAVQMKLSQKNMNDIEILIPDIGIQECIIAVLSSIDERILLNNHINDNLEKLISVAYDKMIATSKCAHMRITDLSQDIKTGGTPSTKNDKYWGGSIPFVTIPDMHGAVYAATTERNITELGASKSKLIPADSIMVSCIATVGLVCISTQLSQTNQQVNSVIPKNAFDVYFLYESLRRSKKELEQIGSTGSATLNVNKTAFGNIMIPYPGEDTTKRYYELVSPFFNQILSNQQENLRLTALRDTLLPELMNGKIDLSKVEV